MLLAICLYHMRVLQVSLRVVRTELQPAMKQFGRPMVFCFTFATIWYCLILDLHNCPTAQYYSIFAQFAVNKN